MSEAAGKERIYSMDIAKGIGIILVMIVHICYAGTEKTGVTGFADFMVNAFGYLMPFFFMLSGYFYKPGRRTYGQNAAIRFKQIMLPYFKYFILSAAVLTLYLVLRGQYTVGQCLNDSWRSFIGTSFQVPTLTVPPQKLTPIGVCLEAFWFLQDMFLSDLVFFAVADWALKNRRNFIISTAGLLTLTCVLMQVLPVHLFWNAEVIFALAGMSLIGAWAGQRKLFSGPLPRTPGFWAVFAACLVISVVVSNIFPGVQLLSNGYFGAYGGFSVYPVAVMTVTGGFASVTFCRVIEKVPVVRKVGTAIGQATLLILMLHITIAYFINQLTGLYISSEITKDGAPVGPLWQSILVIILDIAICLLYTRFLAWRHKKIVSKKAGSQA
jgi:fucose 4-O-acetylase-like acetyltransferase